MVMAIEGDAMDAYVPSGGEAARIELGVSALACPVRDLDGRQAGEHRPARLAKFVPVRLRIS